MKRKTLSLCMVVAGLIFGVLGLYSKSVKQELAAKGITSAGTIVKAEIQSRSKGKKRYVLWADWSEGPAKRSAQSFVVKKDFYQAHVQGTGAITVPAVAIRSLPGNPDSAVLEGGATDFVGMEWLGLVIGLVGLYNVWRSFSASRPGVAQSPAAGNP